MTEAKPCPFCGVRMEQWEEMCRIPEGQDHEKWCPLFEGTGIAYFRVKDWNRRTRDQRIRLAEEALRNCKMVAENTLWSDCGPMSATECTIRDIVDRYFGALPVTDIPTEGGGR